MIIRYFIDGQYLHDVLKSHVTIGQKKRITLMENLRVFWNGCRDNGWLIINDIHDIPHLRNLLTLIQDDENNELRQLVEEIINSSEEQTGDDGPYIYRCSVNAGELLEDFIETCLKEIHCPDCVITGNEQVIKRTQNLSKQGQSAPEAISLPDYRGSATEKKRRSWLEMQSFGCPGSSIQNNSKQFQQFLIAEKNKFDDFLAHFAFGENSVCMIDKCLGEWALRFRRSVAHIMVQLLRQGVKKIELVTEEKLSYNIPTDVIASFINKELSGSALQLNCEVVFSIVVRDCLAGYHDRFVCSKRRGFAIGRGLDILDDKGNLQPFFVYYGMKRRTDEKDDIFERILTLPVAEAKPLSPKLDATMPRLKNCRDVNIHFSIRDSQAR